MTTNYQENIERLEMELSEELQKNNNRTSKRAIFLMATINVNLKALGKAPRYEI